MPLGFGTLGTATYEALPADQRAKIKIVPIAGCRSLPLLENPTQAIAAIAEFLN